MSPTSDGGTRARGYPAPKALPNGRSKQRGSPGMSLFPLLRMGLSLFMESRGKPEPIHDMLNKV